MLALGVVEHLDVIEHILLFFGTACRFSTIRSCLSGLKKLFATALL